MTTFNITTTAPDQIEEITITRDDETVHTVPEDGVYQGSSTAMARIEIVLHARCPADAVTFQQNGETIDIRVEGTGSAPVSLPLRLTLETPVSAVHWHKGYTTKVSKAG